MLTAIRCSVVALGITLVMAVTPGQILADCQWCNVNILQCVTVMNNPGMYTEDTVDYCYEQGASKWIVVHAFDLGREECGGSEPNPNYCNACGWESQCHEVWDLSGELDCHEDCVASLARLTSEIESAIGAGDIEAIGNFVRSGVLSLSAGGEAVHVAVSCAGNSRGTTKEYPLDPLLASSVGQTALRRSVQVGWKYEG